MNIDENSHDRLFTKSDICNKRENDAQIKGVQVIHRTFETIQPSDIKIEKSKYEESKEDLMKIHQNEDEDDQVIQGIEEVSDANTSLCAEIDTSSDEESKSNKHK